MTTKTTTAAAPDLLALFAEVDAEMARPGVRAAYLALDAARTAEFAASYALRRAKAGLPPTYGAVYGPGCEALVAANIRAAKATHAAAAAACRAAEDAVLATAC